MGKSNRRKTKVKPTFLVKPKHVAESPEDPDMRISKILQNLKSAVPDQRLFGLEAVAIVASGTFDDRCRELFKSGIIRLTGPLLLDNNVSIRKAASGAIRNLSTFSKECIDMLVEQDILTPLFTLFTEKYTNEWKPIIEKAKTDDSHTGTLADDEEMDPDKVSNKVQSKLTGPLLDEHTDTFVQAVHILWNICESNSKAVTSFNQANILDLIARCLDPSIYPLEVTLAVGQFLNTIIEDNSLIKPKLLSYQKLIESLLTHPGDTPEDVFLRVLAAGLICNLELNDSALSALKCIENALNFDHRRAVLEVTNCLATTEVDSSDQTIINLNQEVIKCRNLLDAQTLSLELLANLCIPFDDQTDKEEPMDGDWSSDEESMEETIEESLLQAAAVDRSYYSDSSKELLSALAQAQLPKIILERTQALAENELQTLATHHKGRSLIEKINEMRCRSFYCLNNIIEAVDIDYLGGLQMLYTLCLDLSNLIVQRKDENPKIVEASSAALTAGLRRFLSLKNKSNLECFQGMSEVDMKALQEALLNHTNLDIIANLIRVMGLYGQIALHIPNSTAIIQECGTNLLNIAAQHADLWLLSEALDSLMDIFGEDETDGVAYTIKLVPRMKSLHTVFKFKFDLNKKKQRNQPHQDIISTVNSNLMRFIRYKSDRLKKRNV